MRYVPHFCLPRRHTIQLSSFTTYAHPNNGICLGLDHLDRALGEFHQPTRRRDPFHCPDNRRDKGISPDTSNNQRKLGNHPRRRNNLDRDPAKLKHQPT